mmetsp:Transcript_22666/g.55967  ORF Transcript_22666/g.55967 Transcript_22666/m.55967 type:complete len:207 (+) Transcript_22666:61-681(+)
MNPMTSPTSPATSPTPSPHAHAQQTNLMTTSDSLTTPQKCPSPHPHAQQINLTSSSANPATPPTPPPTRSRSCSRSRSYSRPANKSDDRLGQALTLRTPPLTRSRSRSRPANEPDDLLGQARDRRRLAEPRVEHEGKGQPALRVVHREVHHKLRVSPLGALLGGPQGLPYRVQVEAREGEAQREVPVVVQRNPHRPQAVEIQPIAS